MGDKGQEVQSREPVTQILESDEGAKVIVELPGVAQDAIKMALSGDVFKVEAQGPRGKFSTIQVIPFEPDPENVAVSFSQGVLEVDLKRRPTPSQTGSGPENAAVQAKNGEFTYSLAPLAGDLGKVQKDLEKAIEEKAALESRLKLLMVDYQNLKRRFDAEREAVADKRLEETAKGLVEVLDVFQLARASLADMKIEGSQLEQVLKGLEMMEGSVLTLFKKVGLSGIETGGKLFDPNLHECIGVVDKEEMEDESIVSEVKRGFIYKGRTVRPAHVIVNRRKEKKGRKRKD